MAYNEQLTQALSIIDVLNSQSVNNTSVSSIGFNMKSVKRVLFLIDASNVGAAGTVDGRIQSSTTSAFSTAHNVANTNLVQITTNTRATIEVRADQINQQNAGDLYVRLNLTGGGNAVTVEAWGIGGQAEQSPASQYNVSSTLLGQQVVCSS